MLSLRTHNLTLLIMTALSLRMLFGPVWFEGKAPLVPSSSFDKIEERIEADDVDDVDAIVGHDISIIDAAALPVQVELRHDSPLLLHAWRSCSRGPPLA